MTIIRMLVRSICKRTTQVFESHGFADTGAHVVKRSEMTRKLMTVQP